MATFNMRILAGLVAIMVFLSAAMTLMTFEAVSYEGSFMPIALLNFLRAKKEVPEASSNDLEPPTDPCSEDPFAPGCPFVAFPSKPLSYTKVRLCDPRMHAVLANGDLEYTCSEDPTCKSCRKGFDRTSKLLESFRSTEFAEERKKKFRSNFTTVRGDGTTENKSVVVVGLNFGQVYLFLNWACSCEKIGLDPRTFTYVVATDHKTHDTLVKNGFVVEPMDWLVSSGFDYSISSRYSGLANVGPHAVINTMLTAGAEALVLNGYPTLLMDVDVVWLKNPMPLLERISAGKDIIGSYSPREDAFGYVNGGAVYFIPTTKTKVFVSTLANMGPVKSLSDQVLLNAMIRFYKFRMLQVYILPHSVFYTVWTSRAHKVTSYIAHMVGLFKAQRFMRFGFWFFNQTCDMFDEKVNKEASDLHLLDMNALK